MALAQNTTAWILSVAARSKCPRCGQGRLFNGFLTFAKKCDVCGLDYSFADTADGPAFFAMMGMGLQSRRSGSGSSWPMNHLSGFMRSQPCRSC